MIEVLTVCAKTAVISICLGVTCIASLLLLMKFAFFFGKLIGVTP